MREFDHERIPREGLVQVMANGHVLARVGAGECVGEMAVLEDAPRTADVVALTPCTTYRFSADVFRGVLEAHPSIMWGIVRLLIRRLRSANAQGAQQ